MGSKTIMTFTWFGKHRVKLLASLLFIAATLLMGGVSAAKDKIAVHVGTGEWAEANIKAYVEPFKKETGIDVVAVKKWFSYAQLKLWQEKGGVEIDVTDVPAMHGALAGKKGWLEPIDYAAFSPEILEGLTKEAKKPWGVAALWYAIALSYFTDLPKVPSNWAEYWNVEEFPGKRCLFNISGGEMTWEVALLADGVPPDKLYPIDFKRAMKSLDKIRPHIVKWWKDGSDNQQLFADRFVDMGPAFNGRIGNLIKKGLKLKIEWNQGLLMGDYWAIPKGAPNQAAAQRFIRFAARPDRQADFASRIPYGPTNLHAYKHLDPELARTLPSHPDLIKLLIPVNVDWYAEEVDGKSHLEISTEHFTKWRMQ
jgi:putative spermidine/putrescine transport system substrate-binding protein